MFERVLALTFLLSTAGAAAAVLPSCSQPNLNCIAGHGGYATKYTLKAGSKQGAGTCDTLKGEHVGLEKYNPSTTGDPMQQDLTRATLALRTETIGVVADELQTTSGAPTVDLTQIDSQGAFTSVDPDKNDLCHVPTLNPASLDAPAFNLAMGMQGAVKVTYAWSNVRVLTTNAYQGIVFAADLKYTDAVQGCTAEYQALGLYPAVGCSVTDAMGNTTLDPSLCDPAANPDAGHAAGSGINPDFQPNVYCDPDVKLCMLKVAPPNLQ